MGRYCHFCGRIIFECSLMSNGHNLNRNFQIQRKITEMWRFYTKGFNTLIHLPLDATPHPAVAITLTILGLIQLIGVITDHKAHIHLATSWADPNTYLFSAFAAIEGTILTILYVLFLIIRFVMAQKGQQLQRPGMYVRYIGVITAYLRLICETVVLGPLVIGCLTQFQNPSFSGAIGVATIGLILHLGIVYPISLYCSSDTTVLSTNGDRKFSILNAELLFNVYKLGFIAMSVLKKEALLVLTPLFFLLFVLTILKRPFYCFQGQRFKRITLSIVAFVCLSRFCNYILRTNQGVILLQLAGMICFSVSVEWISNYRLRRVLQGQKITVYQIKLLTFMAGQLDNYLEPLQAFIFRHHKQCTLAQCKCQAVVHHLTSKEGDLKDQKVWYEFIVNYIQNNFDLKKMNALPKSELKIKTEKYQHLIFNLAEITLLKLGQMNSAFLAVAAYRNFIDSHHLSALWNQRRKRIFFYYLQGQIEQRTSKPQALNQSANNYLDFQVELTTYTKLLIKAAKKTSAFWTQMGKRDPHQPTLLSDLGLIDKWNHKIRQTYARLTEIFSHSNEILDPITNQYFEEVLNVEAKDPFHIVSGQVNRKSKQRKNRRLDDNTRLYSFDSETPMFFVSVEAHTFGKIQFSNNLLDIVIEKECGRVFNVNELIIPQMREQHALKMEAFVRGDQLKIEHTNRFILTANKKLLFAETLVQLVPSISQGLRYAVFLKKIQPHRLVACYSNKEITYVSTAFEQFVDTKYDYYQMNKLISPEVLQDLSNQKTVIWKIGEQNFLISLLMDFKIAGKSLIFMELVLHQIKQIEEEIKNQDPISLNNTESQPKSSGSKLKTSLKNKSSQKLNKNYKRSVLTGLQSDRVKIENQVDEQSDGKDPFALKKKEQNMRAIFELIIQNTKERKVVSLTACFTFIICCFLVSILVCLIVVKQTNQHHYYAASDNYNRYNEMIVLLTETATNLELLNLNQVVSYVNATDTYQKLKNTANIAQAMNVLVSYYDLAQIDQIWQTLDLQTNGSFTTLNQSFFMAVYDYLQGPINNLAKNYNLTDFNFPFALDYLTPPLSQIQTQFHTFLTNTLYFAIPNLRNLQHNVMKPILNKNIDRSLPIIGLCISIIGLIVIGFVVIVIVNCRVRTLRHYTHRFVQKVSHETISKKLINSDDFINKYSVFKETFNDLTEKAARGVVFEMAPNQSSGNIERILSRTVTELTEIQLDTPNAMVVDIIDEDRSQKRQVRDRTNRMKRQEKGEVQKRKKQKIFSDVPQAKMYLKFLIPCLPLLIFAITFSVMAKKQTQGITNILDFQNGVNFMERDIMLIKLYSMHFGVYSYTLQQYNSMIQRLATHIYEMFYVLGFIMSDFEAGAASKTQALFTVVTSSICTRQQEGVFSSVDYQFNGRGNLTYCQSISNGILKQGYIPSLLHYLQTANRNFLLNPTTVLYNSTQKINYINGQFLSNTVDLIDYFRMVHIKSRVLVREDLKRIIDTFTIALTVSAIIIIAILTVLVVVLRRCFFSNLRESVDEIRSLFTLLSFQTVKANPALSKEFQTEMQRFKLIK